MKFNNQHIYTSLQDAKIEAGIAQLQADFKTLEKSSAILNVANVKELAGWLTQFDQCSILLADMETFAHLISVVDSSIEEAEALISKCTRLSSELSQKKVPVMDAIAALDDQAFSALLSSCELKPFVFLLEHERQLLPHRLSVSEETLLQKMSVDGLLAWQEQYFKLAGSIQADIDGEKVGLASAFNQVSSADRNVREKAYKGIKAIWAQHQDSVVAGLNAINGWRLNEFERRSSKKEMHYLDVACHQSHISRDTLSALMQVAFENKQTGHKAIAGMLKWNNIDDGKPWDLMAPARVVLEDKTEEEESISIKQALDIICNAFTEFDPEMADFVRMMADKGWIDTAPTPNRATGAFCTGFKGAQEPRVFMTYEGTMGNVITLAHELGHAWHAWVLRDLEYSETHYPMTLAETASIFAETLVRQSLLKNAKNDSQKREILWQEAESASALLIDIPARFEFEKSFVEARKESKVSAAAARSLMNEAWKKWFGDSISEYNELFWASKLHFSIAEIGFYNYPYLFGYLFALGVYAQKDNQGDDFRFSYRELLKDTGRMSAEACIQKHLGRDITQAEFWQDSMDIVSETVNEFERLV